MRTLLANDDDNEAVCAMHGLVSIGNRQTIAMIINKPCMRHTHQLLAPSLVLLCPSSSARTEVPRTGTAKDGGSDVRHRLRKQHYRKSR